MRIIKEKRKTFKRLPIGSPEHPHIMHFSEDAQKLFCEWIQGLHTEAR